MDRLRAELGDAEAAWQRFVITRETVSEVLSEPLEPDAVEAAPAAGQTAPGREAGAGRAGAVPGSVVPVRREGLEATVLAPDYQRIMNILADRERSGGGPMNCRQLADVLGLQKRFPRRSKGCGRRRSAWWGGDGWSSRPRAPSARRARRRLMTMVIDHNTITSAVSVRLS
ncbi:hypothetical protein [Streptomyces sp. NPDC000880]